MIPLFIVLALALGAGGTVVASDSARPGDLLFPVDRAVEDIQFAFTPEKSKVDLKIKFANERLDEVESILEDEQATSSQSSGVSEDSTSNLSHALDILTQHLAEIRGLASTTPGIAQAISTIEARLLGDVGSLPKELRIRVRDDQGKIELKTEDGKIKVKVDDGEIEVELEDEGDDEDGDDDSEETGGSNSGPGSGSNATSTDSDDDQSDNSGSGSADNSDDDSDDSSDDTDDSSDDDDGDDSSDDSDDSGSNSGSGNSGSGSNSGSSN